MLESSEKILELTGKWVHSQEDLIVSIWVNEQIDPSGILYSCIACCDEDHAQDCHQSFQNNLTDEQIAAGWIARLRTVTSWDDVPANALKLD
jgi:hypothetical protein